MGFKSEKVGSLTSGNRLFVLPSSPLHALFIFIILHDPFHRLLPEGRLGQVDVEVLFRQFFQGEHVGDEWLLLLA
jgi:hypothetical protein